MVKLPKEFTGLLDRLTADPQVHTVILFGSWARGNNRPDSDIDLLIIREGEFRREITKAGALDVEMVLNSEAASKSYFAAEPDDCAEFWRHAKVLFDRDGTAQRLESFAREIIQRGKPSVGDWQLAHHRFDCEDALKGIERMAASDPLTARFLLLQKASQLTELFFAVRREWTPPPKQRMAVLLNKSPQFVELLRGVLSAGEAVSIETLAGMVREMGRVVFEEARKNKSSLLSLPSLCLCKNTLKQRAQRAQRDWGPEECSTKVFNTTTTFTPSKIISRKPRALPR